MLMPTTEMVFQDPLSSLNPAHRVFDIVEMPLLVGGRERGFTTKGHPANMGVGLDYLVQTVTSNRGSVAIYSFRGALHCRPGASGVDRVPMVGNATYPGTLVELSLHTEFFVGDDGEEEEVEL